MNIVNRRDFIKHSAAASALVAAPTILRGQNLNSKIGMGFIGVGNRGTKLMHRFLRDQDVELAALCDVYRPYVDRNRGAVDERIMASVGGKVPALDEELGDYGKYEDFAELLADPNVDAVCIATPDHWHAVQTIQAMQAGKDVYVEKPLTITIHEGRAMVEAQKQTGQVAAVGLNRRGSTVYTHMAEQIRNGKIGEVSVALAGRVSNMFPDGIGRFPHAEPPADLNWDLWLGPRAERPFQYNITPYKFRWWSEYSSQMGNWGVHYMDAIRWMIGETAPVRITAHGSRQLINDDSDIPDTMEVLFEFDSGAVIKFSINEACSGGIVRGGEIELRGTDGNLFISEGGYKLVPARPGQFQSWEPAFAEESKSKQELLGGENEDSTSNLIRNFLDCVKSRQDPLCTLEDGHRSTTFAHLANIALAEEKQLEWDAVAERFTNSDSANERLHYSYRKPWTLG